MMSLKFLIVASKRTILLLSRAGYPDRNDKNHDNVIMLLFI